MSKRREDRPQDQDPPRRENSPNQAAGIAHQREYWSEQIRQARRLNAVSACATVIAFVALLGLAFNAYLLHEQVGEMQRQVGNMQESNTNNFEAFEDTERPWLSVKVAPGAAGLSFVGGRQAVLAVRVSIKNVGKSIAKDIQVNAKLYPASPVMPVATDAARNEAALCNRPTPAPIGWFDLFPTDSPMTETLDVSALPPAIRSKSVPYKGVKPHSLVGLYVVGCVTYRFSFGAEAHQTRSPTTSSVRWSPFPAEGHRHCLAGCSPWQASK